MKQPMIVTNIRMPQADYLQVKTAAAELGMSVNAYINKSMKTVTKQRAFRPDSSGQTQPKESLYETLKRIASIPNKPMGLSKEDEEIYSI